MYITSVFITALAAASTVEAFQIRDLNPATPENKRTVKNVLNWATNLLTKNQASKQECPAVWSEISTTLTAQFLADGQCTDAARAAIRGAFHDCFNGACDGSLILANECTNAENRGLERLCTQLGGLATQKKVGVADLIQFAAAHAIKTCPGGPTIPAKVGRKDSSSANALGVLPSPNDKAADLIKSFASKGFSPTDLTALIGAHTAGKQRFVDPSRANASFDSTPGQWDNKFYVETQNGKAPFTIPADKDISKNLITMIPFKAFAISKGAWDAAFVKAMTKMSMIGVDSKGLIDCTSALPGGSRKRDIKSANAFDRLKW